MESSDMKPDDVATYSFLNTALAQGRSAAERHIAPPPRPDNLPKDRPAGVVIDHCGRGLPCIPVILLKHRECVEITHSGTTGWYWFTKHGDAVMFCPNWTDAASRTRLSLITETKVDLAADSNTGTAHAIPTAIYCTCGAVPEPVADDRERAGQSIVRFTTCLKTAYESLASLAPGCTKPALHPPRRKPGRPDPAYFLENIFRSRVGQIVAGIEWDLKWVDRQNTALHSSPDASRVLALVELRSRERLGALFNDLSRLRSTSQAVKNSRTDRLLIIAGKLEGVLQPIQDELMRTGCRNAAAGSATASAK